MLVQRNSILWIRSFINLCTGSLIDVQIIARLAVFIIAVQGESPELSCARLAPCAPISSAQLDTSRIRSQEELPDAAHQCCHRISSNLDLIRQAGVHFATRKNARTKFPRNTRSARVKTAPQRFRNWCRTKPRTFSWFSPKENHSSRPLWDHSNCETALEGETHGLEKEPGLEKTGRFDQG